MSGGIAAVGRRMQRRVETATPPAAGFTLVELLASMVIGLVVIAGVVGLFVSQSKVNSEERSRLEMIADLQLAGQIIRSELRLAKDVYTHCSGKVFYQPMDSTSDFPPVDCNTLQADNGWFKLGCSSTSGCICWDRPNESDGCQELIRNIDPTIGLQAQSDGYGSYQIDLYGSYTDRDRQSHLLTTRITVWPRNQQ
ncbi:MAG: prepilin-type N-terminal cleavage/methylation domain-containing protein [Zetaproteobacteria bacterium]|nr:MAG: prepilin-type N-terminal cleavage/methylation domain-containing protein [Zetaproteobacteria bacterium]